MTKFNCERIINVFTKKTSLAGLPPEVKKNVANLNLPFYDSFHFKLTCLCFFFFSSKIKLKKRTCTKKAICFIGNKNATSAIPVSSNITKLKFNVPQNSNLISRPSTRNVEFLAQKDVA